MSITVIISTQVSDFDQWKSKFDNLEEQRLAAGMLEEFEIEAIFNGLMRAGKPLYKEHCAGCHGDGAEGVGNAPSLDGSRVVRFQSPVGEILRGHRDARVPAYADILTDEEIAVISMFVEISWTNEIGMVMKERVAGER